MRDQTCSDAELWAAAVAGDGEAFGLLFDRHRSAVSRHAARLVRDPSDAEDVTAITFLELWRRRSSVRLVDDSIRPWLTVTATYSARNVVRARRRYERFLARLPRPSEQPDLADEAFGGELAGGDARLASALRGLPLRDQRLLSLVIVDDLPISDAAQILGIGLPAAKSRLLRARRRLAKQLSDLEEAPNDVAASRTEEVRQK